MNANHNWAGMPLSSLGQSPLFSSSSFTRVPRLPWRSSLDDEVE